MTGWHRLSSLLFLLLCVASAACHLAGLRWLSRIDIPPDRALRAQLLYWLAAGGLWLLSLLLLSWQQWQWPGASQRLLRWLLPVLLALGLLMRVAALPLPVTHSQDIYRYVWDGAVQRAGLNPYLGPPASASYREIQREQPEVFARINHRHLPTIYPPMAQRVLALSSQRGARGEPVAAAVHRWKRLCGLAELGLLLLLAGLLHRRKIELIWLSAWLLCPLPILEIWLNAHLDVLGVLFLALALLAWPPRRHRPSQVAADAAPASAEDALPHAAGDVQPGWARLWLGGAALALSLLVKPLAGVVLPALIGVSRRNLVRWTGAGLLAAFLIWLPYRHAGLQVTPSLGEYGRRWRSNDGAFAVLQQVSEGLTAVIYRPPYWDPWRIPALARMVSGRDRATVWPDELAGFLARALSGLALLWLLRWCVQRRFSASQTGLLLLTGYALLTPVLHPWYLLWPLLLAPLWRRAAWPVWVLCALAPLAYLPLIDELRGLPHHEAIGPRLIEHGSAWVALALCWRSLRQGLIASEAGAAGEGPGAGTGVAD